MKRKLTVLAAVTLLTLAPTAVSAVGLQPLVPSDCNGQGGCNSICDLATLAQNALNDGIFIAIFLSAILFAWAGWQMVVGSSTGNATERDKGKRIFQYVAIGLVIIISAWLVVSVIMSALTSNANWNQLCAQPTSVIEQSRLG